MGSSKTLPSIYGWPPLQRMPIAAAYTGHSTRTLQRAVAKGRLAVAGKQGRSPVFRRADLDAWLLGQTPASAVMAAVVATVGLPPTETPPVTARLDHVPSVRSRDSLTVVVGDVGGHDGTEGEP